DHFLGDMDRDELLAVIDLEIEANELRQNGRAPRPGLDRALLPALGLLGLLQEVAIDEGTFPYGTSHGLTLSLVTRTDDELVRRLVASGLLALGGLAPRGHRMTTAGGAAFTTTMGMVHRVHGHAAHGRTLAEPARTPRLGDDDVLVVGVRHGADAAHAGTMHLALLARGEAQHRVAFVTAHELGVGAGRTGQLAALARLQLHVV